METHLTADAVQPGAAMPAIAGFVSHSASQRSQVSHEMIVACLPLVDAMARRLYGALPPNSGVELNDLAQSGVLGLVSAGRGYNPATAVPFSIYARYRVEGEMLDSLRRSDVAPRSLRRWQKQASAARGDLRARLHREPTEEELCERLKVSATEMRSRNEVMSRAVPPAAMADGDAPDLPGGPETDPDHICAQRQLRNMLDRLIDSLPARQQQVIRQRYGKHMTLKEIGNGMGVNESRVSQMHRSALETMGRMLKDSGISSAADVQ